MAYAGAEFAFKLLRAIKGEKGVVAPSYVHLTADAEGGKKVQEEVGAQLEYFSSRVELGVCFILLFLIIIVIFSFFIFLSSPVFSVSLLDHIFNIISHVMLTC